MLTTVLVLLLSAGIVVAFFLGKASRNEAPSKSDSIQVKPEGQKTDETLVPEPVASPVQDSPVDVSEPEPVVSETPVVEEPLTEEPIKEDPVIEKPDETVKQEAEPEPPAVLPRINPRDDLSHFILPTSAAIEDLVQFREAGSDGGSMKLPVAIGRDENSRVKIIDLADAPNLFIAGSRACYDRIVQSLKTVVYSLLTTKHPSKVKLVLMDAHQLDFMGYDRLLYHYLACLPDSTSEKEERANCIVSSPEKISPYLGALQQEVEDRVKLLQKARCRGIEQYNEKYLERHLLPTEGHHYLPYIVVVVNEYAEFVSLSNRYRQTVLNQFVRLAHIGKAAGVYLVVGTTYILRDLISKDLIDSFPYVLSYRVNSGSESRIVLGEVGAEDIRNTGTLIFKENVEMSPLSVLDIQDEEFDRVVEGIGKQYGYKRSYNLPYYLPEPWDGSVDDTGGVVDLRQLDERFEEAARLIVTSQRGSTSDLQRRLGMGYAKAGLVMDQLEAAGIVGPQNGSKPREVLVKDFKELDRILSHFLSGETY